MSVLMDWHFFCAISAEIIKNINSDKALKLQFFKALIRINGIMNYNENDDVYQSFLKDLYY